MAQKGAMMRLGEKPVTKMLTLARAPDTAGFGECGFLLEGPYLVKSRVFGFSEGEHIVKGALCPSKSGLMNKHIVKHIVRVEVLAV
jgi:hypothetical protein